MKIILKLLCAIFTALMLLLLIVHVFMDDLPQSSNLLDPRKNYAIQIQSNNNEPIGMRGTYFAGAVAQSQISPFLHDAIIAIEDRKFYTHLGVDPFGIVRAMIVNMSKGRVAQGASTLTQQLAKDLFLNHQRSMGRKIKEFFYALKMEQVYTKKEIFELYINRVYLGAGLYGMKAASERYFGKDPKDLTVAESAMLAGLLKAPSKYCPLYNPIQARDRMMVVLYAMKDAGFITEIQYQEAIKNPPQMKFSLKSGGFGYVADRVARLLPLLVDNPEQDVIVTTTIDSDLQMASDAFIETYIDRLGQDRAFSQAAFVALDDKGQILAMTGGKSYAQTPFNRVVQASRQSGSAFKPFIYAAYFEQGGTANDIFEDKPVQFGKYRPSNYENKYLGAISVRNAFAQSVNTVAVQVANQIGVSRVQNVARKAGIISPMKPYLSMALGAFEVTPLEMTASYIPFFNGGYQASPYLITKITDKQGNLLFQSNPLIPKKVYNDSVLLQMKDIFQAVTSYGTGKAALLSSVATYGKTGTSSDYKDAWFMGHIGDVAGITAGVWLGNDNFSSMKSVTGGALAAPLWKEIMGQYIQKIPKDSVLFARVAPTVIENKMPETGIMPENGVPVPVPPENPKPATQAPLAILPLVIQPRIGIEAEKESAKPIDAYSDDAIENILRR